MRDALIRCAAAPPRRRRRARTCAAACPCKCRADPHAPHEVAPPHALCPPAL